MEVLRTKVDKLQWEVNRLDVENRRLRDGDVEASSRLDLEAEFEESKAESARMAERVRASEEQLKDSSRVVAEAERRASLAESTARSQ